MFYFACLGHMSYLHPLLSQKVRKYQFLCWRYHFIKGQSVKKCEKIQTFNQSMAQKGWGPLLQIKTIYLL